MDDTEVVQRAQRLCQHLVDDGILNSLAALLALTKHQSGPTPNKNLQVAVNKAIAYLDITLQTLDVDGSLPVGFELLVPAMLDMLKSQAGIQLSFPAQPQLPTIKAAKMRAFKPDAL
ncbi:MAG: hypothetical protein L6R39_005325 [Caloplaca ligustica]|nr:MAG: hypothetical protein L6R39_005325 [Caloplaca ligustica]